MKKIIFILLAFISLSAFKTIQETWVNDDPHTQLNFEVTHLGINQISGAFTDVDINLKAKKKDFSDAKFQLTAKTASINTRVEARDNHLKSADFFNTEKFKTLNFTSSSIKRLKENTYQISGELTMQGVSKEITLNAIYRGHQKNPANNKEAEAFQITGTLNRSDFNIGNDFPESLINDEVKIEANIEFIQQ